MLPEFSGSTYEALSHLAAVTERIKLGTAILVAPLHEFETTLLGARTRSAHDGEFYKIAPSQVNPKPVQARIPVLLAANSPAAVKRAGRIADGLIPITSSADELRGIVSAFHDAAREAGRDPADLMVVNQVPWPTPITREPLGDGRPFLGGSPKQIAEDLAAARETGADQVHLAGGQGLGLDVGLQASDVDQWLELPGEVIEAADHLGVLGP